MLLVLGALCDHDGAARFNMIKQSVPGISQKTLTQWLRQLERSGLIARTVLNTAPIGVEDEWRQHSMDFIQMMTDHHFAFWPLYGRTRG
jgi:DNA-binding HxlR family transcriptional regulator